MEYSIGIDIGGTKIAAGLVNQEGQMIHRTTVATPKSGKQAMRRTLASVTTELLQRAKASGLDVRGIGVGTAGQVDFEHGFVLSGTANIHDWNEVPLRDWLMEDNGLSVWVDNDVNVFAVGEKWIGAARDESNIVALSLGTGVGGGVIANNHVLRGAFGCAGEFGHMSVDMHGPECNCGSRGCLELYASGTGLVRLMREARLGHTADLSDTNEATNSRQIFNLYHRGDTTAHAVVDTMVTSLSYGIVSLIHIFNPTMVVLGGGVLSDGDWLLLLITERVKRLGLKSVVEPVKIRKSLLGLDAGLIGAAAQAWFSV